jgi:hypothetical protein
MSSTTMTLSSETNYCNESRNFMNHVTTAATSTAPTTIAIRSDREDDSPTAMVLPRRNGTVEPDDNDDTITNTKKDDELQKKNIVTTAAAAAAAAAATTADVEVDSSEELVAEVPPPSLPLTAEEKKKYANWPLRDIKEPHPNDVLYGRGGTFRFIYMCVCVAVCWDPSWLSVSHCWNFILVCIL